MPNKRPNRSLSIATAITHTKCYLLWASKYSNLSNYQSVGHHTSGEPSYLYILFFFFTSIRYGVGEGRSGRGDAGKLWDAEEMFKLVACFKSLRVFRWMNVEALSAVWRRAGTS